MAAFNIRSFLEHKRFERPQRAAIGCVISATVTIAVLCAAWEMAEESCKRVVLGPSSALDRKFEAEAGTLDPDGPLSLRPTLDSAPVSAPTDGALKIG